MTSFKFGSLFILFILAVFFIILFVRKDNSGPKTVMGLTRINDSLSIITANTYSENAETIYSVWSLKYPVFHFESGDINKDGKEDILVGVIKPTRFDSVRRKRIFIFKIFEGHIRPMWLGSKVSMPLEDFKMVNVQGENCIRTIEKEQNGNYLVAEYKCRGFGIEFIRYLERDISIQKALIDLNK